MDGNSRTARKRSSLQPYLDAGLGIKNHWYPALLSSELAEGEAKGVTICSTPVVLRRARGEVYALRNECRHRGVRLTERPTCLTDETITCWYHGFTYDLESGRLVSIVSSPKDNVIGKISLRTYPVREINNLIFVFMGDADREPHDLDLDLPNSESTYPEYPVAHPTHDHVVNLGIHRECRGDWRLAAESGADPGHLILHRDAALVLVKDYAFTLGETASMEAAIKVFDQPDQPKGIGKYYDKLDVVLENELTGLKARGSKIPEGLAVEIFMPGVLKVENWPEVGLVQYEWYVPTRPGYHEYWQILSKTCETEEERAYFEAKYTHMWEDLALRGFNDDDILGREAMEDFYEDGRGWQEEQLFESDHFIVEWRKLCARHNNGIIESKYGLK